jgi:hypothetical protein
VGVKEAWRKLQKEEIHKFYSSPNIIREIKLGKIHEQDYVACMWTGG